LLQNGFYLSFGEHLLKNEALQQSFIGIDLDRIFIETDDSNADIKNLYIFAADLKRIEVDELVNQIRKNLKTITNGRLA
jgi:TatD DNase family protein